MQTACREHGTKVMIELLASFRILFRGFDIHVGRYNDEMALMRQVLLAGWQKFELLLLQLSMALYKLRHPELCSFRMVITLSFKIFFNDSTWNNGSTILLNFLIFKFLVSAKIIYWTVGMAGGWNCRLVGQGDSDAGWLVVRGEAVPTRVLDAFVLFFIQQAGHWRSDQLEERNPQRNFGTSVASDSKIDSEFICYLVGLSGSRFTRHWNGTDAHSGCRGVEQVLPLSSQTRRSRLCLSHCCTSHLLVLFHRISLK